MNEIRQGHLVERAAMRLRDELGLSGSQPRAERRGSPQADPAAALPLSHAEAPAIEQPPAEHSAIERPAAAPAEPVAMAVLERAGVALGIGRRTRIAEEFSVTAGTVLRALRAGKGTGDASLPASAFGNLLLVTSAKPGEGKTFSALNLAATLAHNGLARVVLVDIDPKPGSITTQLGLEARRGLFDLAADAALRPDAVLVPTAVRDMTVLPLGTRDGGGGEHGLTRRVAAAVERIARRLAGQVVILDASPCLATSEPAALAPMVGLVAVVVEAERTQREEIEHTLDLVKTCPNVMLLLNKIRGASGHAFGDYDYYGA